MGGGEGHCFCVCFGDGGLEVAVSASALEMEDRRSRSNGTDTSLAGCGGLLHFVFVPHTGERLTQLRVRVERLGGRVEERQRATATVLS